MNRASLICNCINEQNKRIAEHKKFFKDEEISTEQIDKIKEQILTKHKKKWAEMCEINDALTDVIMNHKGTSKHNWFYVTVRPRPETEFLEFIKYVDKYISRTQIYDYKLTLEQKDPKGSGEGFHMHCVVDAVWRSRHDCLEYTYSSFAKCTEKQCIQVVTTKNPGNLFQNYCIDYESKDKHKIITKEGDSIWREKWNIDNHYDSIENRFSALSIKSVKTVQNSVEPFILELN